ncbi:MAG: tetratricopeptide repeat protein [Myxococcales bacterium]|nr:tetratricopeptide repeat protein [Myxococcales bacterium]
MNRWLLRTFGSSLALGIALALALNVQGPAVAVADRLGPLTAEDLKELDAMQAAVGQFEAASKDYKGTVSHIVKQEYEKKRHELQARYEGQIKEIEKEEKLRRGDAITLFERWLGKYPKDKRWTPDVIFRLAELYFERSNDDYLAAVDNAQKAADAASKDPNAPQVNAPVTPDYQKTIDLYKRLIAEFPQHRFLDGAHYLLGYCLGEMTKEAEARQALLGLVCQNHFKALDPPPPPAPTKAKGEGQAAFVDPYLDCKPIKDESRFNPEAWTRIGEYHFDYNELELAIAAYARVLQYKDSPYFDKALYKLAWSYYRADKYPEAIKRFDELVIFSDLKKTESGKEGSDLRQESVQYLAISFQEKDWNGDSVPDFQEVNPSESLLIQQQKAKVQALTRIDESYNGRDGEPHVHEIYQRLGDIYYDQTEYLQAIEVYKRLLEKWPYDPNNPKVQDRIVVVYERRREFDKALEERGKLAKDYAAGTKWRLKNGDNREAIQTANELAEMSLLKYATDHHKAAQTQKKLALASTPPDGRKLEFALKEYGLAADGYAKYLETYQNSKATYEYTYFYAETLYFSGRFSEAAVQYEKVRDSNLDNKYLEDSAFNAVKSYELLVDGQQKAGKLVFPPIPTTEKVKAPVTALPIPEDVVKMQSAYDAYAKTVPNSPRLATMTYKAAEIDFKYLEFEKSRPRFQTIIDKYCQDPVSAQAGKAILTSFTIENNLEKIVEWSEKLLKSQCGGGAAIGAGTPGTPDKPDEASGIAVTLNDAKFEIANKLYDAGKLEEAADAFVKVVDGNPTNIGGKNDKALNNAAVGYEKVSRFAAATKLYERIVQEYPKSEFVDEALFRTAINYQKYFEFDKAVVSFQRLAGDARFAGSKHRTDSLFNAAVILENDQAYEEAARLFQQYAKDPNVKREDQAEAFFRSGNIYLKAKDAGRALKTFGDYLRNYTGDSKREIEAQYRIAEAIEQQKGRAAAMSQYKRVAADGGRVAAASDAAEFPAHSQFNSAEMDLQNGLEKMKISLGSKKDAAAEFAKALEKYKVEIARMTGEYNKAIAYKRVTWSLAGYFRIGYVYELLSKQLSSILTAPCPAEIMKKYQQEGCDAYLGQVGDAIGPEVIKIDEEVIKRYRTTLEQAAKIGVSNEWTRLARNRANAFKPEEFPMIKDEKVDFQMEPPQ